jgi:hypothetical protein
MKINYDNKEDRQFPGVSEKYLVVAGDMNQIKASVNAIYDMLASVKIPISIILTADNFSGLFYQNSLLVDLAPMVDVDLFTNDGSGALLIGSLDPDDEGSAGYILDAALGKIKATPGNYILKISRSLTIV